ncbi:hypothetical protein AUK40_02455 [Candidatus Wirthbacteria bacterium CG2_30_54_11]|uniref:Uncharacterized protein n=1 Tax=Candidatus Wirthbacteria bacterium CG2_30_54_11 TaxID=1817892 RepID=A0A1J5IL93_9BACT|nr:MAG: hypothetical protein AUK40_02455 [Candidatus Wirthbacteria bacterium CG2_30_54_11]
MSRKQSKKRSFGHARTEPLPQTSTSTSPLKASAPVKTAAPTDFAKYAYVAKDLKQVAVILGTILVLYLTIFLANQSLHLF